MTMMLISSTVPMTALVSAVKVSGAISNSRVAVPDAGAGAGAGAAAGAGVGVAGVGRGSLGVRRC